MKMRTFIAVEIPEFLREEFVQLQERLKKSDADVKWVEPENMHLTLKFLGDTEENKMEKISEILKRIAQETKQFEITFSDLGAFPNLNFPKVIWVGVDKGKKELAELATRIENGLLPLGFSKEKRTYSAHLTLGRIRSPKNKDKLKKILEEKIEIKEKGKFYLQKIVFFSSKLTPTGPIYTKLAEFPFS